MLKIGYTVKYVSLHSLEIAISADAETACDPVGTISGSKPLAGVLTERVSA